MTAKRAKPTDPDAGGDQRRQLKSSVHSGSRAIAAIRKAALSGATIKTRKVQERIPEARAKVKEKVKASQKKMATSTIAVEAVLGPTLPAPTPKAAAVVRAIPPVRCPMMPLPTR